MHVVELVLANVNEGQHLAPQMTDNTPLLRLVEGYNDYALNAHGSTLYSATGETYGFDLKRYIGLLPAFEQIKLLNAYLHDCEQHGIAIDQRADADVVDPPPTPKNHPNRRETDEQRDNRRFKHSLIRYAVITGLALILLTFGAGFGIMYHSKSVPDNALITSILDNAAAIIKVLFGTLK